MITKSHVEFVDKERHKLRVKARESGEFVTLEDVTVAIGRETVFVKGYIDVADDHVIGPVISAISRDAYSKESSDNHEEKREKAYEFLEQHGIFDSEVIAKWYSTSGEDFPHTKSYLLVVDYLRLLMMMYLKEL